MRTSGVASREKGAYHPRPMCASPAACGYTMMRSFASAYSLRSRLCTQRSRSSQSSLMQPW
eukprot:6192716-Pleurochrysis_carterae.AAC.3